MAEILFAQIQRNGEHMNRNKFGSIRQLPSGRFQVRYRDVHGINRTAKTNTGKALTFDTRTAARKYLVNLESAMDQGKTTGDTSQGLELLRDRVEKYISGARLTKGQLRATTAGLYRGLAADYINKPINGICLGDLPIKSITRADVRSWHFAHESKCKSGVRVIKSRTHPARIWAKQNQIAVPAVGQLPKSVLDAWVAAGAPAIKIKKPVQTGKTRLAQAYRLLRAVLNVAVEDELILGNPCRIKGADKEKSKERAIATPEQVAQLAAAVPDRYSASVILAAYTSMRHSELFGLQRKHINHAENSITVEHQLANARWESQMFAPCKTESSQRTIQIPADLMFYLESHMERFVPNTDPDALIFTTSGGLPVTRERRNWFDTAKRKCDLDELVFHGLRHTGQTTAMRRGASMKDLQRRAGQATEQAAKIYLHGSAEQDRVVADALSPDVELCLDLMNQIKDKELT
jgi:integrase